MTAEEAGALIVQTHPAGAEVFVRGERLGITPLRRRELDSGRAVLELRSPGFETVTRTIELQPGNLIELHLDLRKREETTSSAQPHHAVAPRLWRRSRRL